MMKKSGFTLIEVLAVIVILSIVVTMCTLGIMKIRNNSLEKIVNTKINELEASGILFGQENEKELDLECTINNEKYSFCTRKTVKELIDTDYYKSEEVNSSGQKDLLNNVTNESMLNDVVMIYKKNNRVYAKYIKKDDIVKLGYANISDACKNKGALTDCIKKLDEENNSNETGVIKVEDDKFVDDSIRYSGANPNNFICFGSDAYNCPHANLYRIIGIFKTSNHGVDAELLKLIKYDYEVGFDGAGTKGAYYHYIDSGETHKGVHSKFIDGYWYNSSQRNDWSTSTLNSVNLNTSFLNSLGSWSDYIVPVTWQIGGISSNELKNTKFSKIYQKEVINSSRSVNAKVGLVYVTDYAYAADKSVWNSNLADYNLYTSQNWMYMGIHEWTITKSTELSNKAFTINTDGKMFDRVMPNYCAIRPSFYISSSVKYKSGIGSKSDPIRIAR